MRQLITPPPGQRAPSRRIIRLYSRAQGEECRGDVLRRRPCVMCNYEKNKKTTFKGVSVTVCGLRRHASRASFFALVFANC